MNSETLWHRIRDNLKQAGLFVADSEMTLVEDPYGGWRLTIISGALHDLDFDSRRRIVLAGINEDLFQWIDLVTPEEADELGVQPPVDPVVEDLPLWTEALARSQPERQAVFASDLDTELEPPISVTFYSVKGGVGRSTALAYTAHLLARSELTVFCVDMDLEAPGLSCLFGVEDQIRPRSGLVKVLAEIDQDVEPNLPEHVIRISDSLDLFLLPAGIPDADYARRLRMVDPEAWYRQPPNPLDKLFDLIKRFDPSPDIVLFDSRTGLSPVSAPLLFDLCDMAVITFFPHPQTRTVTELLTRALLRARSSRRVVNEHRLTPEPRFLISPVPAGESERYRLRAEDWVDAWLASVNRERDQALQIDASDIVHTISYHESVAVQDVVSGDGEAVSLFQPVADWVRFFVPSASERDVCPDLMKNKPIILDGMSFDATTAEHEEHPINVFVATDVFRKAMKADHPVVVGRKGTGKTSLFRWLQAETDSIVAMCPSALRSEFPWVLSPEGFDRIEAFLGDRWREFWILMTAISCYRGLRGRGEVRIPPPQSLSGLRLDQGIDSESELIDQISHVMEMPGVGLAAWEWLAEQDRRLSREHLVLFDGLDTGFGHSEPERKRRRQALEGLFSFVVDRDKQLTHLRMKTLIRDDIWRSLSFENKSHLHHKMVRLQWRDKFDYARTILKRAMLNPEFRKLTAGVDGTRHEVDRWPEDVVMGAWNLLVGERMKGAKSAYTLNWVWNRLADAKGDHSPRSLAALFAEAQLWELAEHKRNPYYRSLMRPRALVAGLQPVSIQAVSSLMEEFKDELSGLVDHLRNLGRTPIEAGEVETHPALKLATEVGLIGVYEQEANTVVRYKVPDLYVGGLSMRRKGQA